MPGSFSESTGSFVSVSGSVTLGFGAELQGGTNSLAWNGTNNSGRGVSGGTYTIKVSSTDAFGNVQTWTQSINVLPQPPSQSLSIYNSAGELVANVDLSAFSGKIITQVGFPASGHGAFSVGPGETIPIDVQVSDGSSRTILWDGKSGNGNLVSSGSYTLQLSSNSSVGSGPTLAKSFEVLDAPGIVAFGVAQGPNPIGPMDDQAVFLVTGLATGENASVKLYNLAGELVAQGVDAQGNGRIVLTVGNWSAGIYVAVVEKHSGAAIVSRKLIKIAVQR